MKKREILIVLLSILFANGLNNLLRDLVYLPSPEQLPAVLFNLFIAYFSFISLSFVIAALIFSIKIKNNGRKELFWIGVLYVASGLAVLLGLVSLGYICFNIPHISAFYCMDPLSSYGIALGYISSFINFIGFVAFFMASFQLLFYFLALSFRKD